MRRANIRERLKTKSGCLTCRRRKKKCDETVPICRACHRNKWPCLWPGQKSVAHSSSPSDHVESPLASPTGQSGRQEVVTWMESPLNGNATNILTTTPRLQPLKRRYILYNYFFREGFLQLMRPDVYPGFAKDLCANTISIGAAYPCAMELFLAFSALCISVKHPDVIPFALSHYSAATSSTISQIQDANVNGSEDWLMTMACVMCVFERLYSDFSCNSTLHIQAAAHMMFLRRSISSPNQSQPGSPIHRIYTEAILYNTVITAFLADDAKLLGTQRLFQEFGDELDVWPFPEASHEANSPLLLGVPQKLFRLVLDISCLARQAADRLEDRAFLASKLQEKINFWLMESESNMGSESSHTGQPESDCWKEARLYSLAADILLLKISRPETRSTHPHIRYRVNRALDILKTDDQHHMYLIQQRCWPITIIGCALSDEGDVMFLRRKLESSWTMAYVGDVKRTTCILENIWKMRAANGRLDHGSASRLSWMDGMDLLLRKDGLSIFLN